MEFNEKLQELRKQKGLTQEELAEMLFVSRAAVSKWESGRGTPSIDSLKAVSKLFSVSIDDLLSGDELLTIAEKDSNDKQQYLKEKIFSLLDISVAVLLFMPFFGQNVGNTVVQLSLPVLTEVSLYTKTAYYVVVLSMIIYGVISLLIKHKGKTTFSLLLNVVAVMMFIISPQPYAAALLFVFLAIKVLILLKKQ